MPIFKRTHGKSSETKSVVGRSSIWSSPKFSFRQYTLIFLGLLVVAGGIALFAATPGSIPGSNPMDGNVALSLPISGTPFAANSFWNTPLPASTPPNPNNADYVNEITNQVCYSYATFSIAPTDPTTKPCTTSNSSALNVSAWSAPLYVVPANQPLVPVSTYCGQGDTDQNMSDSNWTSTGWTTTTTSATHTTGNTSALKSTQFEPVPGGPYQVTYTFSGSPVSGSTMAVTMGSLTVGSYTFSSSTPGQDNFTVTKVVTAGTYSGYLTFTPSATFNGTISAVSVLPYKAGLTSAVAGGVPIPADAHGAAGTDEEIQIYQPSTNKEWEFWQFQKYDSNGDWGACWGGVINSVSTSNGIFPNNGGATATSLPLLGGTPRIEEFQAGQINHAMGLSLGENFYSTSTSTPPNVTVPANVSDPGNKAYSWPATRNDGANSSTLAIPEGQRFRLNPNLNLSTLKLTPMAMAIAVAAQKYGFVVNDSSSSVSIRIGDPTSYTVAGLPNPYTTGVGVGGVSDGNQGLFDGVSQGQIMANFPWGQLEALPFNYGEPDTTPPTVSLSAPSSGATVSGAVSVSANASDNVGVASVQFELDGKALGSPSTAAPYTYSWNTTGVGNGTHTLTAIASDVAGNTTTAAAVTVTVKNADTTPPSVPTGLKAVAPTSATVNLSWSASTDNIGVAEYKIYRNGSSTALATVTAPTTTYTDAAVSASTAYSYTVTALDAAGNQSAQSTSASVTTPANPDKTPPSVPTGLHSTGATSSSISLAWNASTDTGGSGLAGYHVYRNGSLIASPSTAAYTNTGLTPSTNYTYSVSAYDNAANGSAASTAVTVSTQALPDTTPPSIPAGLTATAPTSAQVQLSWDASTDNVGVTAYKLYRNGSSTALATVTAPTTTYTDAAVSASTAYSYTVTALDAAGNQSAQSTSASVTTPATPDKTPPSVPTNVHSTATTDSSISLGWNPSTDNTGGSGLAGYHVYRNGTLIASPSTNSFTDSGLNPSTSYSYSVSAYDNAANGSAASTVVTVSTQANPDKTPPSVPKNLSGQAIGQTSIVLSWSPSTDTGGSGLAGYHLYWRTPGSSTFTLIASPTIASYTITGLTPGTDYIYKVSAYDNAANGSAASLGVRIETQGTSPDKTPPTAPAGLHSILKDKTQTTITLSWNHSSDSGGSGLAGYHVYRNNTLIASPSTNSFTDTGLTAGTTYTYYVTAYDNAGNISTYRNTITVRTRYPWWQVWKLGQ
jgi:fibronectin type 3 domain-containing protein